MEFSGCPDILDCRRGQALSRKVVFATISLHNMAGGLERNIVRIANYVASQGYDVSLLSFDLPDAESFYPINSNVAWYRVGRTPPHKSIGFQERLELLWRIRAVLLGNPTVIVFHHGLLPRITLAGARLNMRLICSERSALSMYNHIVAPKWNISFFLMRFADKILVQFENYKKNYPFFLRPQMEVIPNMVEQVSQKARPGAVGENGRFKLLAVGRLCDQKNYACLIDAFSKIATKHPLWDLYIVGEGGFRSALNAQIKNQHLENRVFLAGNSINMQDWYLSSNLYVMPSKWEGFPNALAEAMSYGLPSIGFAGCEGVADLIEVNRTGLLAEGNGNAISLSQKLALLMSDDANRKILGAKAADAMMKYAPEKIYPQWIKLLENL